MEKLYIIDMIEEKNNLVYDHYVVPVGLHYYGITEKEIKERISRGGYKNTSLYPYIKEYGWNNIITTIVLDNLTKKEAKHLEDRLIKEGWERGDCINQNSSGYDYTDNPPKYKKEYNKQYREKHKEELKIKCKQWCDEHKEHKQEYDKKYRKINSDKIKIYSKQYSKQRLSSIEGKIYNRVTSFNQKNPDRKLITPLEAKEMYLLTGYIPDFIKNDDLI